jgi:hypothetical protein
LITYPRNLMEFAFRLGGDFISMIDSSSPFL